MKGNKQALLIRPYEGGDWESACKIYDLARPDELEGACDPRAFIPFANDDDDVVDFNESTKFVAEVDNEIVGFSGVNGNVITWLYVRPDFSGQSIGKQLLLTALELIDGVAFLYVLPENTKAVNLYLKVGFNKMVEFDSDCAGFPCRCLEMSRDVSGS